MISKRRLRSRRALTLHALASFIAGFMFLYLATFERWEEGKPTGVIGVLIAALCFLATLLRIKAVRSHNTSIDQEIHTKDA
jgi:hypothetical protein